MRTWRRMAQAGSSQRESPVEASLVFQGVAREPVWRSGVLRGVLVDDRRSGGSSQAVEMRVLHFSGVGGGLEQRSGGIWPWV